MKLTDAPGAGYCVWGGARDLPNLDDLAEFAVCCMEDGWREPRRRVSASRWAHDGMIDLLAQIEGEYPGWEFVEVERVDGWSGQEVAVRFSVERNAGKVDA